MANLCCSADNVSVSKKKIGRRGREGQGPFCLSLATYQEGHPYPQLGHHPVTASPPGAPDREAIVAVLDDVTLIGEIPFLIVSYKTDEREDV